MYILASLARSNTGPVEDDDTQAAASPDCIASTLYCRLHCLVLVYYGLIVEYAAVAPKLVAPHAPQPARLSNSAWPPIVNKRACVTNMSAKGKSATAAANSSKQIVAMFRRTPEDLVDERRFWCSQSTMESSTKTKEERHYVNVQ